VIVGAAMVDMRWSSVRPLLKNCTYSYGEVTLGAVPLPEKPKTFRADQVLALYQDGTQRVSVFMDERGNATAITVNDHGESLFDWQENTGARIRRRTSYGRKDSGEVYWDLDCDGQFDMKFVIDGSGEKKARYIFMDSEWRHVDRGDFNLGRAESGFTLYHFEVGMGWIALNQEEQAAGTDANMEEAVDL